MRKVTRNEINKDNMVALGYCQCQDILNKFAYDNKVGYNSGIYGWNYDLYRINEVDIVTGYNVPYSQYSNEAIKNKLVALENEVRTKQIYFAEGNYEKWLKKFQKIFE